MSLDFLEVEPLKLIRNGIQMVLRRFKQQKLGDL
jgi:hypothetical protein